MSSNQVARFSLDALSVIQPPGWAPMLSSGVNYCRPGTILAAWDRYEQLKKSKIRQPIFSPQEKTSDWRPWPTSLRGKLVLACHAYVATEIARSF